MTREQIDKFLREVYNVAKEHPELQSEFVNAFTSGTMEHIKQLREQTTDMETIAVAFAALTESKSKSTKLWANNLIISKLKKHQNVTAFMNWGDNIEKIEEYLINENLIKR